MYYTNKCIKLSYLYYNLKKIRYSKKSLGNELAVKWEC